MLLLQNKKSLISHYANIYYYYSLLIFQIIKIENFHYSLLNDYFNYYMKLFIILIIDMLNIKRHYMYVKSDML